MVSHMGALSKDKVKEQGVRDCLIGCSRCTAAAGPPAADALAGWRLVVSSAGIFLVPLVLAIAGSALVPMMWKGDLGGLVGGAGGLLAGLVGSVIVERLVRGSGREAP